MKKVLFLMLVTVCYFNSIFSNNDKYTIIVFDEDSKSPIEHAMLYSNNKLIAVSNKKGEIIIPSENILAEMLKITSIKHQSISFLANTQEQDIIYLKSYETKHSNITKLDKYSISDIMMKSLKIENSKLFEELNYKCSYIQYDEYQKNNKVKKSDASIVNFDITGLDFKSYNNKNKVSENIKLGIDYLFQNNPVMYKSYKVFYKTKEYDYSINKIFYNADLNTDVIEITAVNKEKSKYVSNNVIYISYPDCKLLKFQEDTYTNNNSKTSLQYPSYSIIYSTTDNNVSYPAFIESSYLYSDNRSNSEYKESMDNNIIINIAEN